MNDAKKYEEYANGKAADYAHRLVEWYSKSHPVTDSVVFDEKGLAHLLERVILESISMVVESRNKENNKIL